MVERPVAGYRGPIGIGEGIEVGVWGKEWSAREGVMEMVERRTWEGIEGVAWREWIGDVFIVYS